MIIVVYCNYSFLRAHPSCSWKQRATSWYHQIYFQHDTVRQSRDGRYRTWPASLCFLSLCRSCVWRTWAHRRQWPSWWRCSPDLRGRTGPRCFTGCWLGGWRVRLSSLCQVRKIRGWESGGLRAKWSAIQLGVQQGAFKEIALNERDC